MKTPRKPQAPKPEVPQGWRSTSLIPLALFGRTLNAVAWHAEPTTDVYNILCQAMWWGTDDLDSTYNVVVDMAAELYGMAASHAKANNNHRTGLPVDSLAEEARNIAACANDFMEVAKVVAAHIAERDAAKTAKGGAA